MARVNLGDCIKTTAVNFSGATVETIPANTTASKVLLEFYTNVAGVTAIGADALAYTPIVTITENGDTPDAGFTGVKGFRLFNMAAVLIEGKNNIANAKFTAFAAGYTVYCQISYFK